MTDVRLVGDGTVNNSALRSAAFSLSPDAQTIVFGQCSCAAGLATVKTDGTGFYSIPGTTYLDTWPRWSPDGTKLAFILYNSATFRFDVATMNPDGTDVVNLTAGTLGGEPFFAQDPQWSPDGKRIVFWGGNTGEHLFSIDSDGTGFTQLTFGNFQKHAKVVARWQVDRVHTVGLQPNRNLPRHLRHQAERNPPDPGHHQPTQRAVVVAEG